MSRTGRRSLVLVLGVAMVLLSAVGLTGPASAKAPPTAAPAESVTGTLADGTGSVEGTFSAFKFVTHGGTVWAIGTFEGTVTDGDKVKTGKQTVKLPVDLAASAVTPGGEAARTARVAQAASCEILNLVLGPLDLNLLGLEVHLDTVVLDITAQQGPGNLLGNLLCAVAGLLDGPTGISGLLQQITNLLNQILGALGG